MFSPPDEETVEKLNKRVRAFGELSTVRAEIEIQNKAKSQKQPLPVYPLFSSTPSAEESNVCTGTRLSSRQGLRLLDPDAGPKVSGRAVTLEEFVTWVEDMDAKRKCKTYNDKERPLPYPQNLPFRWIDHRNSGRSVVPAHALWPRTEVLADKE
ncbi:hypothetical protein LZ554_000101 [Drepanopeziza brunnea f. sp. 'monogermtubi']|nr:hypothetical protein LZ554_000101 [Drepanopeziza brunnea f. sp. 'monogermtubi']